MRLDVAERALGEVAGAPVRLRVLAELRADRVVRCSVEGIDRASVVVKAAEHGEDAYRGITTIHNEQAALTMLGRRAPGMAPELLAAVPELGVLVLEDLGDGDSLASLLLGNDPDAARDAALRSAAALGALHAATIGHAAEHAEVRGALSASDPTLDRVTLRDLDLRALVGLLPGLLTEHDLPRQDQVAVDEIEQVLTELTDPGDFLALSSGDPCPDNQRNGSDGVRFFDFEAAGYRHALVDAAHLSVPFPNCWCWRALPAEVAGEMQSAYRGSLAVACAAARDTTEFEHALARTTAAWLVWTLHRRLPKAASDAGMRQRTIAALRAVADVPASHAALPALRAGPMPRAASSARDGGHPWCRPTPPSVVRPSRCPTERRSAPERPPSCGLSGAPCPTSHLHGTVARA